MVLSKTAACAPVVSGGRERASATVSAQVLVVEASGGSGSVHVNRF